MATYTASQSTYITMVPPDVDTVTLTGSGTILRFITTSGSAHAYFTVALPGQTPATPTAAGNNTYATVHGGGGVVDIPWHGCGAVVKIVSSGTPTIGIMLV